MVSECPLGMEEVPKHDELVISDDGTIEVPPIAEKVDNHDDIQDQPVNVEKQVKDAGKDQG